MLTLSPWVMLKQIDHLYFCKLSKQPNKYIVTLTLWVYTQQMFVLHCPGIQGKYLSSLSNATTTRINFLCCLNAQGTMEGI
jgi:hypothetical protein